METIWFALVALMITAYILFDGFDLGVGAVYLLVARTPGEQRVVLASIGPVWNANEVWLVAAGGTVFFAFPLFYASVLSGFYLPLNMVLWLLVLRGIGLEFRAHMENQIWHTLFDGFFVLSSTLLIVMFGAALANILRGVELDSNHIFFEPLWTNFRTDGNTGILDWYTCLAAVLAVVALGLHGALYVVMRTVGTVNLRSRLLGRRLLLMLTGLTVLGVPATVFVRERTLDNFIHHPLLLAIPLGVAVSLAAMWKLERNGNERGAFLASCCYLLLMLAGAAASLYPILLPSDSNPEFDITVLNAAASDHALRTGLLWWTFGLVLAMCYFILLYRKFRGRITEQTDRSQVRSEAQVK